MNVPRAAALAALVLVAVLSVATFREIAIGRDEVVLADAAADKSAWWEAILHARAAAEAFVPGSPWPARGWSRLEAVGRDAEARGDDATALLAYGAMRTAALGVRGPGTGAEVWRTRAEEGLTRVAGSARNAVGPHVSQAAMLDALHTNEPPATGTLALLAASATAMLVGLAWLARAQAPRKERLAQAIAALGFAGYTFVSLFT